MGKMVPTDCVICGSEKNEQVLSSPDLLHGFPGEFILVRCTKCGLVYQNPRPDQSVIGKYYEDNYAPHGSVRTNSILRFRLWLRSVEMKYFLDYGIRFHKSEPAPGKIYRMAFPFLSVAKMLLPRAREKYVGTTILDVGCGNGYFMDFLKRRGWKTQGVEISESAAEIARQEFGLDVHCGTLEDTQFADCSFDVIYLSHSLEHMFDPPGVLEKARRILKDDGLIIVSVQNIESAGFRLFGSRWCGLDLPRHLYDFSPDTFKKLVANIGGLEPREVKFMASPVVLFYSLFYELRHRRLTFLKPLLILTIPLQFLFCLILAIMHRSDLMTIYLRKSR